MDIQPNPEVEGADKRSHSFRFAECSFPQDLRHAQCVLSTDYSTLHCESWHSYTHLLDIQSLNNTYLFMRHGKSEANELGVLMSRIDVAGEHFGLTEEGRRQVKTTAEDQTARGLIDQYTIICCSPLLRAKESAALVAQVCGAREPIIVPELTERGYGSLESAPYDLYWPRIGLLDMKDPFHEEEGVESVAHILERTTRVVAAFEQLMCDQTILFVGHHESLQILNAGFQKMEPKHYFDFAEIPNGRVMRHHLGAHPTGSSSSENTP